MKDISDSPIFRNDKAVILAYDHGLEHGPENFKPNPESADPSYIFELAEHSAVTALAVQKGVAEGYSGDVNLLVKLNGNSSLDDPDDYYSPKQCSVEYAVEELGAEAVGYTIYAGSDNEDRMWQDFREVQEKAREYGVPVVMWAYPRGHGIEENPEYSGQKDTDVIAYAARLGMELGADVVKCKYPGSYMDMHHVVNMTGKTRVVMSGGEKRSDEEFLEDVENTLEAGGNGVAVGRNVFQRENPEQLLDRLEETVFK